MNLPFYNKKSYSPVVFEISYRKLRIKIFVELYQF